MTLTLASGQQPAAFGEYAYGSGFDATAVFHPPNTSSNDGNIATGTPTDPATVTALVIDPNGTRTTYTYGVDAQVTKLAVGVYLLIIASTAVAGSWRVSWTGTGAVQSRGNCRIQIGNDPNV